ncbi:MAG: hypothetical protein IKA61_07395 [Clostridia bacterium]|nr:hypothetical protein [Clostridia bacterium]
MKKIISFLLMVMMALSLCSCGLLGGEIKELSLKEEGKRIRDYEDALEWSADLTQDYENWLEEGEVRKGQWYSISGQEHYEYSDEDGSGEYTATISGKYFYSPYAFEQKLSLKVTQTGEYYEDGESYEYKNTAKIIYVEGAWYVKTEYSVTSDEGKSSHTEYDNSPAGEDYTELLSVISNPTAIIGLVGSVDVEEGRLFVSEEAVEWTESESFDGNSYTHQGIIEFEKESIFVKSIQTYNQSRYYTDLGYRHESTSKITVKKTLTGSVKRPNDYYKYE